MRMVYSCWCLMLAVSLSVCPVGASGTGQDHQPPRLSLTAEQLEWVGQRIFHNECGGRESCLVHWNQGEAFPSLGIGHFIWYPDGVDGPFRESFPALLAYMEARGLSLPDWLQQREPRSAPWPDRDRFLAAQQSGDRRIAGLRRFLLQQQAVQAAFLFERGQQALADVIAASDDPQQTRDKIHRLSASAGGVYALVDYVNFKGEGLLHSERYQGEGWGLLQVLEGMPVPESTQQALDAFRESAASVLTRRASLAERPIERERWLPGWLNRIDTYREPGS